MSTDQSSNSSNVNNELPTAAPQQNQGGRPMALDDFKRHRISTLVARGAGIRSAARALGCDASTIRREMQRNPEFRHEFECNRAQAQMMPLKVLHDSAVRGNWRAAMWWIKRLEGGSAPAGQLNVLGKREANRFVGDLIDILDQVVTHPLERRQLDDLLTAAMPGVMKRAWEHQQTRRRFKEALSAFKSGRPAPPKDASRASLSPEEQLEVDVRRLNAQIDEESRANLRELHRQPRGKNAAHARRLTRTPPRLVARKKPTSGQRHWICPSAPRNFRRLRFSDRTRGGFATPPMQNLTQLPHTRRRNPRPARDLQTIQPHEPHQFRLTNKKNNRTRRRKFCSPPNA
jgi:hypothetical protein